ncbi:MAG: hypothetical protein AAF502_22810 [Bacteroidota bacterium]
MHKLLTLLFCLSIVFTINKEAEAQASAGGKYTVSEVLNDIKGQWRQQYKIIDGNIFYDRRYLQTSKGVMLAIDTSSIHTFRVDQRGRTKYSINWEEANGQLQFDDANSNASWDLKQGAEGVNLIIRDAYYAGCPIITRRIVRINQQQLLVLDLQTGDHYYYTRR